MYRKNASSASSGQQRQSTEFVHDDNTEPADPDRIDHTTRRATPLAPSSIKADLIPDPFITDNKKPVTVGEAGEIYLQTQRHNWKHEPYPSKYEYHLRKLYPRILEADRHFQAKYENMTTAMVTRRLSPLDETDDWLTPWECNEMLHGGCIHRSIRQTLNYHLGDFKFEWIAVTAPTESAGTPHEHRYLWIDDPNNDITTDLLNPVLDKHLKHCLNAYEQHHQYRADGSKGALTVEHDPPLVRDSSETFFTVREQSQTYDRTGDVIPNTPGAKYIAGQLVHLPLADKYDGQRNDPPQALFEGAALGWATPRDWFRCSQGVPKL